jgi:hypothetical protein
VRAQVGLITNPVTPAHYKKVRRRAVRVELDPLKLFHYGVGLEDIRSALASATVHCADRPEPNVGVANKYVASEADSSVA